MAVNDPNIPTMNYEQAFAELEEIVYGLETNQKSLEEAMRLFERGQALAARCAELLDQAELRVRQLGSLDDEDGLPEDGADGPYIFDEDGE